MKSARCAGVMLLLFSVPVGHLSAQHFAVGPQVVFGDYRETTADLRFRGSGLGAKGSVVWKKFSADVFVSKIKYKPHEGVATTAFDASELDVQLRYYIAGPFSAELGFMNRKADPEFEAQSMGALTLGAQMSHLLGPGVRMGLDAGLMVGPKFSGGGSASAFGAPRLGLSLTVDALKGRLKVIGDYEFQSVSRTTDNGSGSAPAPIQQSLGRVGAAIAF